MLAKAAAVFAILAGILLAGCARTPPLVSDDGGRIVVLNRSSFSYEKPGAPATSCRLDAGSKQWICDDGTVSELVVAGLPFKGILLVEFDGKQFVRTKNK